MEKYKLLLDESGTFESNNERYIIIGGLFFNEKYQEEHEKIIRPFHKHLCDVYNIKELHGTNQKKLYNYVAPLIGSVEELYPVIFVIDKKKSFIFDKYDKKSFKYNKAIEHLINKLLDDKLIKEDDELKIKIDNIDLNKSELKNLNKYLPNKFNFVKSVSQGDSKNNICLQLADVIVNHFSKKTKCKIDAIEIKLLNPKIYCFLVETINDYIKLDNS